MSVQNPIDLFSFLVRNCEVVPGWSLEGELQSSILQALRQRCIEPDTTWDETGEEIEQ